MTIKDEQVWKSYTQTVKAVRKKAAKPLLAKTAPEKNMARKAAEKHPVQIPKSVAATALTTAATLERAREKAMRQGDIEIDARLDLHGMTQAQAFEALAVFMQRCAKTGQRHLLIITGKGRDGAGVLRAQLKNWLGQLPQAPAILALRPASVRHGGAGAFYVLLRKPKVTTGR